MNSFIVIGLNLEILSSKSWKLIKSRWNPLTSFDQVLLDDLVEYPLLFLVIWLSCIFIKQPLGLPRHHLRDSWLTLRTELVIPSRRLTRGINTTLVVGDYFDISLGDLIRYLASR